jgi:hypothetical protein
VEDGKMKEIKHIKRDKKADEMQEADNNSWGSPCELYEYSHRNGDVGESREHHEEQTEEQHAEVQPAVQNVVRAQSRPQEQSGRDDGNKGALEKKNGEYVRWPTPKSCVSS